jgi:hypothetical protein
MTYVIFYFHRLSKTFKKAATCFIFFFFDKFGWHLKASSGSHNPEGKKQNEVFAIDILTGI